MKRLSIPRIGALLTGALLSLSVASCGGRSDSPPTPSATVVVVAPSDAVALETVSVPPTPRPTSTPYAVPPEPASSGGVTTTLNVHCYIGERGIELRLRYGSMIRDTDDPAATLRRIRIYVDGSLRVDTGPLSHRIYVDEAFFGGRPGRAHSVQMIVETRAAPTPRPIVQFAQCPAEPDGPTARVVF